MTKKVRRQAHDAPRRAWLALATQPVCGHAGAPEQPWAPDEHVSTQTYRKQHSLCLSPFSHLDDVKPELNNKLLSSIALKREFEASELIWGVTSRVQRGGAGGRGGAKRCTGSIPHSVCADSREGWCGGWCVCPGTFLMAAGSQVGRQCRRCFENSQPLSALHQTTEISHIIWHQMNNFDILAKKKVLFDEILIWWLIFFFFFLHLKFCQASFCCEGSHWRAPHSNFKDENFINCYNRRTLSESRIKGKTYSTLKVDTRHTKYDRLKALTWLFNLPNSPAAFYNRC